MGEHELDLVLVHRVEMAECLHVLYQRVHAGHAAEDAENPGVGADEAERPGGSGLVGFPLLEIIRDVGRDIREPSAEERLHHDDRNLPLVQFRVEVVGIHVPLPVRVFPVDIVHFNLAEIPDDLPAVIEFHELVEGILVAVEGESEVPDPSLFLLSAQEFEHSVFDIPLVEGLDAAAADRMEKVIVEIVRLEVLEGVFVHLERGLAGIVPEVGELSSNIIGRARETAQGDAGGPF